MAYLKVESQHGMYHISRQDVCLQFPETGKNTRVLWLLLRAFHDPDTGKLIFTHGHITKAFHDKRRQNIQHVEREFNACGGDIPAYLQRKCHVDSSVVEAVADVLRQHPLAPATKLCPLVLERLNRTDVTPANIRKALQQMPCLVIRPILQRQWERGEFNPTETLLLQLALAALQETSSPSSSSIADTLSTLGLEPADPDGAQEVQQQQAEAVPTLLDARATLAAQVPVKIRLMVVAFTLSYWKAPAVSDGLVDGCFAQHGLELGHRSAVVVYPIVNAWIVTKAEAIGLAVDEKWLTIKKTWHSWCVSIDEATGLPVAMEQLHTRTTWACCRFLLTLKHLGLRPRAIITDGLDGYASSIPAIFPSAQHLLCLFHHQQGVTRWLRDHAGDLPKKVVATLKRKMNRVVHTCDPRTALRRLNRFTSEEGA
ncbi:MAG: hypothetical protein GY794_11540 [bacterium]|nr:hypothetical protein [bacterium]